MIDLGPFQYAESGRRVMQRAMEEARHRDHNFIASEHILLGLIGVERDLFNEVMQSLNIDPEVVIHALNEQLSGSKQFAGRGMRLHSTVRTVLRVAYERARQMGRREIESVDLLVGVFQTRAGTPVELLQRLGADAEVVLKKVMQVKEQRKEGGAMELRSVKVEIPEGCNIIIGHTHFIKTIEDLYEIMVGASPHVKFGIAFCEASGPCLIRVSGNDESLQEVAVKNAQAIGAGHTFVILLKEGYPINFLNAIKQCQEVCTIHCATANPVEVIVAETSQGRGVLGVVDGASPKGVEGPQDIEARKKLLRQFGYKL